MLSICQHAYFQYKSVGGQDFNCSEMSTRDRDELGGFVGNATTRENNDPRSKNFSAICFIILSGWKQPGGTPTTSGFSINGHHGGRLRCLYQRKRNRFCNSQIVDPMRLKETASAGTHPHKIDRRAYTLTAGNNVGFLYDACNHSLAIISFGRFDSSSYVPSL